MTVHASRVQAAPYSEFELKATFRFVMRYGRSSPRTGSPVPAASSQSNTHGLAEIRRLLAGHVATGHIHKLADLMRTADMSRRCSSDPNHAELTLIERLMPLAWPGGRPWRADMPAAIDTLVDLLLTGCRWRMLPYDVAPPAGHRVVVLPPLEA